MRWRLLCCYAYRWDSRIHAIEVMTYQTLCGLSTDTISMLDWPPPPDHGTPCPDCRRLAAATPPP